MNGPLVSKLSIVAGSIAVEEPEADDKLWGGYHDTETADFGTVDYMTPYGHPLIENTSYQYSSLVDACYSDEKPLWWLVLRWLKMLLLKTARSYHAKPLLLVAGPLCIGIAIGFFLGKWHSRSSSTQSKNVQVPNKKEKRQQEWEPEIQIPLIGMMVEYISVVWYFLRVMATFLTPEKFEWGIQTGATRKGEDSVRNMRRGAPVASNAVPQPNLKKQHNNNSRVNEIERKELITKEDKVRNYLKSDHGTLRECDVPVDLVPKHIAVIMDGNRRYGKAKYGSATKGHWDGSSKLVEFAKWCIAEKVAVLTVYAFSSENWKRDPSEIAALMQIFTKYCDELRIEAIERNIKIMVLSTDYEKIPGHVREGVKRMVNETQHCDGMIMNICLSYGSRNEIVGATKLVIEDVLQGKLAKKDIDEKAVGERLLTRNCGGDPDVLIRTSGELRLSNFLLWQLAYSEFFFVDKPWPAIEKNDLLEVIRTYAKGRNRRYGK